jgi:hypothetical protein
MATRIHEAVKQAVGPMGLSVAEQMQRLAQAVTQFSQGRPAEHRADAEPGFAGDLDRLNRDVGASMTGYSDVLKQAASAFDPQKQELLFDHGRRPAERAEGIASH